MSIPELCARIQDVWLSRMISGTTWGYPIVGAVHVLAIAIFGGAVLYTNLTALGLAFRGRGTVETPGDARMLELVGLAVVLATGTLLFAAGAIRYYGSVAFWVKMVLLALILLNAVAASRRRHTRLHAGISLTLWAAVIVAARGIAYF